MKSVVHVASPPPKPLLIHDGDCAFCSHWVHRLQRVTADGIDYLPFQDPQIVLRFPEIPREQLASAVHLIQPDGAVLSGAEAVFLVLDCAPDKQWLLRWYRRSPLFAKLTEAVYRFVANHRRFFSAPTRLP